MPNIGPLELAVVLIIALVIFGPKRLPELGRSMGKGFREFKNSITGNDEEEEKTIEQTKRELDSPSSNVVTAEPVEGEVVGENRV
jgi:sec-independent protein translocase protein TatA